MMNAAEAARWLRGAPRVPAPRVRLVCLPYAGGGCTTYHTWSRKLPLDVEVLAVQLPGRQDRFGEKPLTRLGAIADQVAAAIAALPPRRTVIYGHSLGGRVAFELARRLGDAGTPPEAIVVGAALPPHLTAIDPPIHALPESPFLEAIHSRYGTPWAILGDADLMSLSLPSMRADLEVMETYEYAPDPAFSSPITVLRGSRDARLTPAVTEAWAEVTAGMVTTHEIDAGHFFVDTHADWVIAKLAALLTT